MAIGPEEVILIYPPSEELASAPRIMFNPRDKSFQAVNFQGLKLREPDEGESFRVPSNFIRGTDTVSVTSYISLDRTTRMRRIIRVMDDYLLSKGGEIVTKAGAWLMVREQIRLMRIKPDSYAYYVWLKAFDKVWSIYASQLEVDWRYVEPSQYQRLTLRRDAAPDMSTLFSFMQVGSDDTALVLGTLLSTILSRQFVGKEINAQEMWEDVCAKLNLEEGHGKLRAFWAAWKDIAKHFAEDS